MSDKYEIVIIGSGNVAEHLIKSFCNSAYSKVIQVYGRDQNNVKKLGDKLGVEYTSSYSSIKDADLYIIAVSDNAISEVSSLLPFHNRLVAHTSGAMDINIIDKKNTPAVFYPIQSFTKNRKLKFSEIPICIECEDKKGYDIILEVGKSISNNVNKISSKQRVAIHLSAVFVNNFTNHMFHIGKEIANNNNVDFDLFKPLIKETIKKIETLDPKQSQTGPAVRNDTNTMSKHIDLMKSSMNKDIYKMISKSIFEVRGND